MYYNTNNNDYYNSYKKELAELEAYRKEEDTQKIIKFILYFLIIFFFIVIIFYLYKNFNPIFNSKKSFIQQEKILLVETPALPIVIREEELPQSIQLLESDIETKKKNQKMVSSMSEKDIALIVKIIISQMNTKVEKPLDEQLQEINNKKFVNKDLKDTNHYNKIVLTKDEVSNIKNKSLMNLKNNLNSLMHDLNDVESNYRKALETEVLSRKNEMRIIIVQRGDTLSKIAKKAYGNNRYYKKIFSANPEVIKNPNQIFVGQRLRIPS